VHPQASNVPHIIGVAKQGSVLSLSPAKFRATVTVSTNWYVHRFSGYGPGEYALGRTNQKTLRVSYASEPRGSKIFNRLTLYAAGHFDGTVDTPSVVVR
jgi:hypothetical protein